MPSLFIEAAAAISPLGQNLDTLWHNILQGETTYSAVQVAGNHTYYCAETHKGLAQSPRAYGDAFYAAARDMIRDLRLEAPVDAVFFATAVGNLAYVESRIYEGQEISQDDLDFAAIEALFHDTGAAHKNTRFIAIPTGCCAGLQAVGLAKYVMPQLEIERAIIMSLDFALTPLAFEAFDKINATTGYQEGRNSHPSRPFCKNRDGFLFSDGGGAIVVSTAARPGMPRISGYGCVSSAYHMTDIAADGVSIRNSIELAMDDAGVVAREVGHVNLHASGTQQNDLAEYNALTAIFGERLPTVTAFKGNHGHALSGANLLELTLSWKMLRERIVPPFPRGLEIDAFNNLPARSAVSALENGALVKTASGFSGIHAAVVMEM